MHLFQLTEAETPNRPVVVFGGRFQPYHRGHHAVYKALCNHFGDDNVWVATSNKVTEDPNYLTFDERKRFMLKQGVRDDRIVQCKNPAFSPHEIFKKFSEPLAYIAVGGEKNNERYGNGDFFEPYPTEKGIPLKFDKVKEKLVPLSAKKGYYLLASPAAGGLSGTDIRRALSTGDEGKRKTAFKKHLGEFDPELYKLLQGKLATTEAIKMHPDPLSAEEKKRRADLTKKFRELLIDMTRIMPLKKEGDHFEGFDQEGNFGVKATHFWDSIVVQASRSYNRSGSLLWKAFGQLMQKYHASTSHTIEKSTYVIL